MKIEIFNGVLTPQIISDNNHKIFVLPDNNARIGKFLNFDWRVFKNTIGIRTKKGPSLKPAAFYTDSDFIKNTQTIREDILNIKAKSLENTIVFLNEGYGNSDKLNKTANKTYQFLCQLLQLYFDFDNKTGEIKRVLPGFDQISKAEYISLQRSHDIIQPDSNQYFDTNSLRQNLYTVWDLIKSGQKISFTSKREFEPGSYVIFTQPGKLHSICRVLDCFDAQISCKLGIWNKFEAWSDDFRPQILPSDFQTQIKFISTLDSSGNMVYDNSFFSKKIPNIEPKILGNKLIVDNLENSESINKLLKKRGLSGQLTQISKTGSVQKIQLQTQDEFIALEFKKGIFFNSLKILLTSKNSFL